MLVNISDESHTSVTHSVNRLDFKRHSEPKSESTIFKVLVSVSHSIYAFNFVVEAFHDKSQTTFLWSYKALNAQSNLNSAIEHSKKNGAVELFGFLIPEENQGNFRFMMPSFPGDFRHLVYGGNMAE
jgi:hypothetical protein